MAGDPTTELNTRISRVEQRVEDLDQMVRVFGPTAAHVERLGVQIEHIDDNLDALGLKLESREERESQERRDTRRAFIALVGVILAALISAGAAIVVAVA